MVKGQAEARLDAAALQLRSRGYAMDLTDRRVSGFPFRLRIAYGRAHLASTSGWAIDVPGLVAQAYLHDLTHWVLVAPQGVTVTRPKGGPLSIRGQAIRASIAGLDKSPWRVALEGVGLSFTAPPAGKPFYLDRADRLEAYLRPAVDGSGDGEFLLHLEGARPHPHTVAWNLAPDAPVSAMLQGRIMKLAAARGPEWRQVVKAWAAGGGEVRFDGGRAQGGVTTIRVGPSAVTADPQGRLSGEIRLALNQAPQEIDTDTGVHPVSPPQQQEGGVPFGFVFANGETRLGPVPLGPSPRLYGQDASAAEQP